MTQANTYSVLAVCFRFHTSVENGKPLLVVTNDVPFFVVSLEDEEFLRALRYFEDLAEVEEGHLHRCVSGVENHSAGWCVLHG